MQVEQHVYLGPKGWQIDRPVGFTPDLILAFGGIDLIPKSDVFEALRKKFPEGTLISTSTAGEIADHAVMDNTVVCAAIRFANTVLRVIPINTADYAGSSQCGKAICAALEGDELCHILILSDGSSTNGDELVKGIMENLPEGVLVTGGLAADAGRFTQTFVGVNEVGKPGRIAAIGFYGSALRVSHGSQGGWDPFGPVRQVTRAEGNVLFELDGSNALELYKNYLGEKAAELPGSALLFPLCILGDEGHVVRTILSIDEAQGSMTFAGDIPERSHVQFMMANFDRLIDGATEAASSNQLKLGDIKPELVLMISCVGRKIVLGPRIEEEVESVREIFGEGPVYIGYYSNGEISPVLSSARCTLHNQTMTITTYAEVIPAIQ